VVIRGGREFGSSRDLLISWVLTADAVAGPKAVAAASRADQVQRPGARLAKRIFGAEIWV